MEITYIGLIEDDKATHKSLVSFLEINPDIKVVLDCYNVKDFLNHHPFPEHLDLMLLDIGLPDISGIEAIPLIKKKLPQVDIVMLTSYEEDEKIFEALCAGACAYVSKRTPLSKLTEIIDIIKKGGSYMSPSIARKVIAHFNLSPSQKNDDLSPRQIEIIKLLVDGHSYSDIADKCYISINTVRSHIKNIYAELGVNKKADLIKKYFRGDI